MLKITFISMIKCVFASKSATLFQISRYMKFCVHTAHLELAFDWHGCQW